MRQRHTDILRRIAMLAITLVLAVAPMLAQAQTALAACHALAIPAPAPPHAAAGPSEHRHQGHQHAGHQAFSGASAAPAAMAPPDDGSAIAVEKGRPASPEPGPARMIAGLACVLHCSVLADAHPVLGPATHVLARTAPVAPLRLASLDAEPAVPPPRR
ncbi:hypothetical protein C2U72_16415 [Prosthecomicrobium hirschii]|uniref:hypothetical protein n=1 Tax=Prosthecodimorpha hirschii TaxID=665126 RepID=UPI00112C0027|nr:hypothetical protein [Prosthecomicrobium hirschii]TPQ49851.1 hypothetical protein C2U72_16415 [Prosthecomicrobium hirschii]